MEVVVAGCQQPRCVPVGRVSITAYSAPVWLLLVDDAVRVTNPASSTLNTDAEQLSARLRFIDLCRKSALVFH